MIARSQFEVQMLMLYRMEEIHAMDVSRRHLDYESGSISRRRDCGSCFAVSRPIADNNNKLKQNEPTTRRLKWKSNIWRRRSANFPTNREEVRFHQEGKQSKETSLLGRGVGIQDHLMSNLRWLALVMGNSTPEDSPPSTVAVAERQLQQKQDMDARSWTIPRSTTALLSSRNLYFVAIFLSSC